MISHVVGNSLSDSKAQASIQSGPIVMFSLAYVEERPLILKLGILSCASSSRTPVTSNVLNCGSELVFETPPNRDAPP